MDLSNNVPDVLLNISSNQELSLSILCVTALVDGYYVAYKLITTCISFMFIEMKFIHCHSWVMFAMKFMSICND